MLVAKAKVNLCCSSQIQARQPHHNAFGFEQLQGIQRQSGMLDICRHRRARSVELRAHIMCRPRRQRLPLSSSLHQWRNMMATSIPMTTLQRAWQESLCCNNSSSQKKDSSSNHNHNHNHPPWDRDNGSNNNIVTIPRIIITISSYHHHRHHRHHHHKSNKRQLQQERRHRCFGQCQRKLRDKEIAGDSGSGAAEAAAAAAKTCHGT